MASNTTLVASAWQLTPKQGGHLRLCTETEPMWYCQGRTSLHGKVRRCMADCNMELFAWNMYIWCFLTILNIDLVLSLIKQVPFDLWLPLVMHEWEICIKFEVDGFM